MIAAVRPPRGVSTPAYVLGGIDLVRALGLAGIRSVVVDEPGSFARHSRFASATADIVDARLHPHELAELLLRLASGEAEPPILYYEGDFELLFISRFREQLRQRFRFVIAAPELVEDLVDKVRFSHLAETHSLPTPPTRILPSNGSFPELELEFPVVVKQATRDSHVWDPLSPAKVIEVGTSGELRSMWPGFAQLGRDLVVQELIPGAETTIESYHVYLDEDGQVRGEFTGRKIRTYPPAYGYSTALITTTAPDVAELGRDLSARIGLTGVAKFDFKRGPDGELYLLEINPRFNLWHHLGAKAGVNLPSLVHSDLRGRRGPAAGPARAGVRWASPRDLQAARAAHVPLIRWVPWALSVEAKSVAAADDPMPLLAGGTHQVVRALRSRISGLVMRRDGGR